MIKQVDNADINAKTCKDEVNQIRNEYEQKMRMEKERIMYKQSKEED